VEDLKIDGDESSDRENEIPFMDVFQSSQPRKVYNSRVKEQNSIFHRYSRFGEWILITNFRIRIVASIDS
jgi:hypothetical protein